MSVLVLVAHPDDEVLGMAGVIASAQAQKRWVRVAVATNGEQGRDEAHGLRRQRESLEALERLGLRRLAPLERADVFFLGYRDGGVAAAGKGQISLKQRLRSRLHGFPGLSSRLGTWPSRAAGPNLAADFDALLRLTEPMDVYTHAGFDGHPDHAEVHRQLVAAVERLELTLTVHSTLMHPSGAGDCLGLSAARWPNPPMSGSDPSGRLTPRLDVEPPPHPACAADPAERSWGPLGPPDDLREVPSSMQQLDERENLKWQLLSCHRSQLELGPVAEGYMRAFVKRHEFFWTQRFVDGVSSGR